MRSEKGAQRGCPKCSDALFLTNEGASTVKGLRGVPGVFSSIICASITDAVVILLYLRNKETDPFMQHTMSMPVMPTFCLPWRKRQNLIDASNSFHQSYHGRKYEL